MTSKKPPQWQAGKILQSARESLSITKREAARRAGISESRWRQLESGCRYSDGKWLPASAPATTLTKAARAVELDPGPVLVSAGKRRSRSDEEARDYIYSLVERLNLKQLHTVTGFIEGILNAE